MTTDTPRSKTAARVRRFEDRRKAQGYREVRAWLRPHAAAALDSLVALDGRSATEVIELALIAANLDLLRANAAMETRASRDTAHNTPLDSQAD